MTISTAQNQGPVLAQKLETPEKIVKQTLQDRALIWIDGQWKIENNQYFKGGIIHNIPTTLKKINPSMSVDPVSKLMSFELANTIRKEFDTNIGIGLTCSINSEMTKTEIGMIFGTIIFNKNIHEFNTQLPPRKELIQNRAASISLIELSKFLNTLK